MDQLEKLKQAFSDPIRILADVVFLITPYICVWRAIAHNPDNEVFFWWVLGLGIIVNSMNVFYIVRGWVMSLNEDGALLCYKGWSGAIFCASYILLIILTFVNF